MASTAESLFERYGRHYKWYATVTVMTGTLAMLLSATSITVAIPAVTDDLLMNPSEAQWLVTGFLAAMTAAMLTLAWLVDTLGERTTFMGALVVFTGACVIGGFAHNGELLIFARVLQGATAGIIQPLAMVVIFRVFQPNERGKGVGIYGLGALVGPAIGPVVGGLLIDAYSWRAVFFAMIPICSLAVIMGLLFLPKLSVARARGTFDWVGFALLLAALVSLLWAFSNSKRLGWSSMPILVLISLALIAAVSFIMWELYSRKPLLNLQVYRSADFVFGSILSFINGAVLFGTTYLIPLFMQNIQGFSATDSGLVLLPAGLAMAAIFLVSGYLSDLFPVRVPTIAAILCLVLSSFLMMLADANTAFWLVAFWILLGRIGLGIMNPPVVAGSLRPLPMDLLAHGSGALSFARQLGAAFGVNMLAVVLEQRTDFHAVAIANEAQFNAAYDTVPLQMEVVSREVFLRAHTLAFQDSFFVLGLILTVTLIPAWFMGNTAKNIPR